jgi:hypothetical protein
MAYVKSLRRHKPGAIGNSWPFINPKLESELPSKVVVILITLNTMLLGSKLDLRQ